MDWSLLCAVCMVSMCFSNPAARLKNFKQQRMAVLLLIIGLLQMGCEQQTSGMAEKQSKTVSMALTDLQGKAHSLADYRGKWIVVNYWATWCPPCLEEIPELVQFYNGHKDRDAVVWGINREEVPLEKLAVFVRQQQMSYPVFQVLPDSVSVLGAILGMPVTYLISPKGEVVARHLGLVTVKKLEKFIQNHAAK